VKVGDLVKFDYVNGLGIRSINNKLALYLGDKPIYREDGVVVNNFEVWLLGEDCPTICDGSMKRWLRVHEVESR
tara:strand:- start:515 stop:736 length:222 start_codon:yes stop_codon:yes gene_type:complete